MNKHDNINVGNIYLSQLYMRYLITSEKLTFDFGNNFFVKIINEQSNRSKYSNLIVGNIYLYYLDI